MDYSKLSDAEIAQKVWKYWSANVDHDDSICAAHSGGILYVKDDRWVPFAPCNNPADAWPIIQRNRISLIWVRTEIPNRWDAGGPCHMKWATHEVNPLRAAMIVFLMMQGDE